MDWVTSRDVVMNWEVRGTERKQGSKYCHCHRLCPAIDYLPRHSSAFPRPTISNSLPYPPLNSDFSPHLSHVSMPPPNGPRDPIAGPDSVEPPFPLKLRGPVIKGFGRGSKEVCIQLLFGIRE